MRDVLGISAPFTLWLASFSALYALHGLVCSDRWSASMDPATGRIVLIVAALLAIGLQLACLLALRVRPAPAPFLRRVVLILAVAALVAMVWTAVPVAATSACA